MKRSTKTISIILIFFLIIAAVIIGRTMIGNHFKKKLVKSKNAIDKNIKIKKFKVIDARNRERFEGKVPEPRKGLRSGSIKNSFCIPFNLCLNKDKTFKNKEELENVFKSCLDNIREQNIVFSCGSGVTACVLALAYSLINDKYQPCIYDGSWAEYGLT